MATLAATAAPKLSEMSEGTKQEKTMNEIDKIIGRATSFYQDATDLEGRGRFPGQGRFDMVVGGATHAARSAENSDATYVQLKIMTLLETFLGHMMQQLILGVVVHTMILKIQKTLLDGYQFLV